MTKQPDQPRPYSHKIPVNQRSVSRIITHTNTLTVQRESTTMITVDTNADATMDIDDTAAGQCNLRCHVQIHVLLWLMIINEIKLHSDTLCQTFLHTQYSLSLICARVIGNHNSTLNAMYTRRKSVTFGLLGMVKSFKYLVSHNFTEF